MIVIACLCVFVKKGGFNMPTNQNNVLVPNQQYRDMIETYGIGNPTSLPCLVEALRQYVLSLPLEPDQGLAEKVAALETQMSTVKGNISTIQNDLNGVKGNVSNLESDTQGLQEDIGNVTSLTTEAKVLVSAVNEVFNQTKRMKAVWQDSASGPTDFFIHPGIARILIGVFSSTGTVSYFILNTSNITTSQTQLTEIKLGSDSVTVYVNLVTTGRYKINISNNASISRGLCLVLFDTGYIE